MMGENGEEAAAAVQEIQVAGPTVQAIRVVTETRNLRTQPFVIPDETNAVGKAWQEWLGGIEREFRFFKISEAVDKNIIFFSNHSTVKREKNRIDSSCIEKTQEWASRLLIENHRTCYHQYCLIRTHLQNQSSYLLSLKIMGYLSEREFT